MSKEKLLTIIFLFLFVVAGYSQSNETLGDNAMSSGNYEQAVEYFMEAVNQNPTEALKKKLNLATILRNEFRAIDQAITNQDADELETHIANVLMIDPNNRFVENKRTQYAKRASQQKKQKTKNFFNDVFDFMGETFLGSEERQDNFHYLSLDEGISYVTTSSSGGFNGAKMAQHFQFRYYEYFPIAVDFNTQLGIKPTFDMWSVGGGSCFFIGDHVSIDYGLGYHQNVIEHKNDFTEYDELIASYYGYTLEEYEKRKDSGLYYRAGFTLMGGYGFGISYSFNHYSNRTEQPFNAHIIRLIACPQNVFSPDWEVSDYVSGIAFIAIHAIALTEIISVMK